MGRDETDVKHYLFCSRVKRGWVGGAGQASKIPIMYPALHCWLDEGGWVGQGKRAVTRCCLELKQNTKKH
jgi:hypothetical protein